MGIRITFITTLISFWNMLIVYFTYAIQLHFISLLQLYNNIVCDERFFKKHRFSQLIPPLYFLLLLQFYWYGWSHSKPDI